MKILKSFLNYLHFGFSSRYSSKFILSYSICAVDKNHVALLHAVFLLMPNQKKRRRNHAMCGMRECGSPAANSRFHILEILYAEMAKVGVSLCHLCGCFGGKFAATKNSYASYRWRRDETSRQRFQPSTTVRILWPLSIFHALDNKF